MIEGIEKFNDIFNLNNLTNLSKVDILQAQNNEIHKIMGNKRDMFGTQCKTYIDEMPIKKKYEIKTEKNDTNEITSCALYANDIEIKKIKLDTENSTLRIEKNYAAAEKVMSYINSAFIIDLIKESLQHFTDKTNLKR